MQNVLSFRTMCQAGEQVLINGSCLLTAFQFQHMPINYYHPATMNSWWQSLLLLIDNSFWDCHVYMYIHTSCTAPVYLKTSQEVKSWHSHNAIFHWDFQKYSFRIICYHWLTVSGISKIMHWRIVISHDRILYHCSNAEFLNPEHKCSGCKREDVMSVSYCITCDKKLCPHHQQVFIDIINLDCKNCMVNSMYCRAKKSVELPLLGVA